MVKKQKCDIELLRQLQIKELQVINKSGSRIDPCGTPFTKIVIFRGRIRCEIECLLLFTRKDIFRAIHCVIIYQIYPFFQIIAKKLMFLAYIYLYRVINLSHLTQIQFQLQRVFLYKACVKNGDIVVASQRLLSHYFNVGRHAMISFRKHIYLIH